MIKVIKRNGDTVPFEVCKIHKVCEWATMGISGVSISDIEINTKLQIYNGISTKEIHSVLINSANNLTNEHYPNYQYVASKLQIIQLRKEVFNSFEPCSLLQHIKKCIDARVYDKDILKWFTEEEINLIDNNILKHDRDTSHTYSALRQLMEKYLVQDRKVKRIYETPQMAYILVAMMLFRDYEGVKRMKFIEDYYDGISLFKINLSTPIMSGVRTPLRQYSSCCLIDVGDSLDSIFSSSHAIGIYSAKGSGIGLNVGAIRPVGSNIRNSTVISTGLIPFLKVFEGSVKSVSQNSLRGGCWKSGTKIQVLDKLKIDGVIYELDTNYNGMSVREIAIAGENQLS